MATQRTERRLAAIFAADIAGYSRLMGAGEEGTLARVRVHRRELIDRKIDVHRGRIVKTTGDRILIEFPSIIEAVSCALALQRGMTERKRIELLCELVPQAGVIALLVNPHTEVTEQYIRTTEDAVRAKGVLLAVLKASNEGEVDAAFAQLHADALLIAADPFLGSRRDQLVALASSHAVPAIYWHPAFVAAGGLISYGADVDTLYRQAGIYAGRILKGVKPADLPVQQPTTFKLVVNLKTAKALGLTVPPSILARADEVIE